MKTNPAFEKGRVTGHRRARKPRDGPRPCRCIWDTPVLHSAVTRQPSSPHCAGIRRRGLWELISHQPSCMGLPSYQGLPKELSCPGQTWRDVTGSLQLGGRPSSEPAHAGAPICNFQTCEKAPPFDSEPLGLWHFPIAAQAGQDSPDLTGLAHFGLCMGAVVVTQPRDDPERFILR